MFDEGNEQRAVALTKLCALATNTRNQTTEEKECVYVALGVYYGTKLFRQENVAGKKE